jgi:hypothetical protein
VSRRSRARSLPASGPLRSLIFIAVALLVLDACGRSLGDDAGSGTGGGDADQQKLIGYVTSRTERADVHGSATA